MPYTTPAAQLSSNKGLSKVLQNKLAALNPLDNVTLSDDIWRFQLPLQIITVDFTLFTLPYIQFAEFVTVSFGEQKSKLSLVDFAKLVWLEVTMGKATRHSLYRQTLTLLALLMAYLRDENLEQLEAANLEDFYSNCVMQNPTVQGLKAKLSAPAYSNRFEGLTLPVFKRILAKYKVTSIIGNIRAKQCDAALNKACLAMLNMTRLEYKKGGSFNFLGLEVGKHYIDHCNHLIEQHLAYATAIRRTVVALFDAQLNTPELRLGRTGKA